MKIKSSFKDYYDHVAHTYGGGDPKFVYARVPIATELCNITVSNNGNDLSLRDRIHYYRAHGERSETFLCKNLVICGKKYLLVSRGYSGDSMNEYRLFTEKNFPDIYSDARTRNRHLAFSKRILEDEIGHEIPALTEISRLIGAPVYLITGIEWIRSERKYAISIDSKIPVLADYDIPTIISPEQLYQDLSYYVANKMHSSPDLVVNDNQTDKEKIAGHGFDLKQSFRHRK